VGKVIAKLGDFEGIDPKGIVRGLLFPASLAFSPDGQWLYVTNLTLNLPFAGAHPAIDSAWTLQVQGDILVIPEVGSATAGGGTHFEHGCVLH
jgi:hypothetical protein